MTDVILQISGTLFNVPADVKLQVMGGPLSIQIAPKSPVSLLDMWDSISDELYSITGIHLPNIFATGPWSAFFHISGDTVVEPTLWLSPTGANGKFAIYIELQITPPIGIGGKESFGGLEITLEPNIQVWSIYVGYTQGEGLDLRAKISTPTKSGQAALPAATSGGSSGEKFQIVTYPFPVPAQNSVGTFQLKYLGIGQRVGPTVVVNADDPMAAIFDQLETQLVGDDPKEILTKLANTFYQPDRNWFIAADLAFMGWELRVLFNDPTMYGLSLSAGWNPPTPFSGLFIEILYQKLSPNLGVYYGALTLPYFLRRIVLEGVILILPGFSIWVYTNGDFRVNIGWPLGDSSIGIQVGILNGIAGFYFAKLRSADNPGAQSGPQYDLILAFGIGLSVFVNQSFNASIFSATLSVSVTATLQGLLAWQTGGLTSGPPDHYWFAGTAGIAVLLQGTVDFAILKASVTVSLTANAGVAFETGYQTIIAVSASVSVEVSVKVAFFTIHLSFGTTVSTSFTIGGGNGPASVNGPLAPGLSAFAPSPSQQALHATALASARSFIEKRSAQRAPDTLTALPRSAFSLVSASPQLINLYFVLQPTATYTNSGASINLIAALFIESPSPTSPPAAAKTDFENLLVATVMWLLNNYSTAGEAWSNRFQEVSSALGSGSEAPPGFGGWAGFANKFKEFMQRDLVFCINDVDGNNPPDMNAAAVLPVFEDLVLTYTDANNQPQTVAFNSFNLTPSNYPNEVNEYFAELNWAGSAPASIASAQGTSASLSTGPSMASYLFYDYFLMLARNAINALLPAAQAYEAQHQKVYLEAVESAHEQPEKDYWGFVDLFSEYYNAITGDEELDYLLDSGNFNYVSAAGLGSRYMLHGLQLPDPEQTPSLATPAGMSLIHTDGLYVLTGQQFAVASGVTTGTAQLTTDAALDWLVFESGSPAGATCTIPLQATVPPQPSPQWQINSGSPSGGAEGVIQLSELPPLTAHPLYFSLKNQIAWTAPDNSPRTIMTLPPALLALAKSGGGIQLQISTEPPPDTLGPVVEASPDMIVPTIAGLLIRLSLSRVPANMSFDVGPGGSPAIGSPGGSQSVQYLPYVYQLSGTDEATRDLIYAALQQDLSGASVQLLYTPVGEGQLQSAELSPSVLIAKTNLSTLNQVARTGGLFMAMLKQLPEYQDFAPIGDVSKFLRLIWEVSVVNAPGFFLFYLTADGDDLPSNLFADAGGGGQAAQFDILIQFASQPQDQVAVAPWGNSIWFDGTAPRGALYAAVLGNDNLPVPQYSPTYPAGYVGFEIDWDTGLKDAGPEIPVDTLYQMIQYLILPASDYTGSIWSLPVGPTKSGAQNAIGDGSPGNSNWAYQQTVPVFRFAGEQLSPPTRDRYCAVGKTVELGFRLIDIYGNPLPDIHQASFTPLYQDPLISIGQWPGTYVDYNFQPSYYDGEASLVLTVSFDPESIVPGIMPGSPSSPPGTPPFNPTDLWRGALGRYELILDQLEDPHMRVAVTTSLAGKDLGDAEEIRAQLREFVIQVIAQIKIVLELGSPADWSGAAAQPVTQSLVLSVSFSAILALPVDILPVTVNIAFERDQSLVYPPALAESPTVWRIIYAIPARIEEIGSPQGSPTRGGINMFAAMFEAAFAGFDGADGVLKLAQRSGVQTAQDTSEAAALWVVRWSRTAGISVQFQNSPVYFALKPLSTKLITHPVNDTTYSNVDLDLWAQSFLAAVDSFLQPQNAIAVALLDERDGTDFYDKLMRHKESLADSVPRGLNWILEPQMYQGNWEAAHELLNQAMLNSLSSAFTVSTVAQFPAAVQVIGRAEDAASPNLMPPRLFGGVAPPVNGSPGNSSSPNAVQQYTLSNGELDIASGSQWMTILVSVAQPKEQAELELPLGYHVSYLQHDFEPSEKFMGYTPSSWLKFVLPSTPPLNMQITGNELAHIPIPLLFYPQSPVLVQQTASSDPIGSPAQNSPSNIQNEIAQALEWDYQVQIEHDWARQDELWFTTTYNLPVTEAPLRAFESADPTIELFEALAGFRDTYAEISPSFGSITNEAYPNTAATIESPGRAQDLISRFTDAVCDVAEAWANLYKPHGAPLALASLSDAIIIDNYYLYLDSAHDGLVYLFAATPAGGNPKYWPKITLDGATPWEPDRSQAQPPDSPGGWWKLKHDFGSGAAFNQMTFEWGPLDVLDRQTATLSAYIKRNANLLGDVGIPTNPVFIYTTPTVQFGSPIIPLIQRGTLQPSPPEKTLVQTLESILQQIVSLGRNMNPLLRLGAGYSYQLVAGPSGATDSGLRAFSAILLADNVSLGNSGSPMPQIASDICREIGQWYQNVKPSTSQALLIFSLTLFGTVQGQQFPLVQIEGIPIMVDDVPASWWVSTE